MQNNTAHIYICPILNKTSLTVEYFIVQINCAFQTCDVTIIVKH